MDVVRILYLEETAVTANDFPCNITSLVGGKKLYQRRHFIAVTETVKGDLFYLLIPAFPNHGVRHIRIRDARRVGIYGDFIGSQFRGGNFGKQVNGGLAASATNQADILKTAGNGRGVYDPVKTLLLHGRKAGHGHQHLTFHPYPSGTISMTTVI
jgi:hypothetical protein